MSDTRKYTCVTEDVFACMKEGLKEHGIDVPAGGSGEIAIKHGAITVKVHFTWNGTDVLELRIDSKPFFVPASKVWGYTDEGVLHCGGQVGAPREKLDPEAQHEALVAKVLANRAAKEAARTKDND